jgi:hypothetical protein
LLSSLRKKARAKKLAPAGPTTGKLRVAILGGYSLYPLHELIENMGFPLAGWSCALA